MATKKTKPLITSDLFPAETGQYVKFSDKLTDSLEDITGMINRHKDMIDAIQELGIQLTGAFDTLHTVTVKYAGVVNGVLDILLPLIEKIPLFPARFVEMARSMERITQQIIDNSANTTRTIRAVNDGLRNGDVERLRGHSMEMQDVNTRMTAIIPEID
jgi:hypothetical protein